jgi:hypothetical protein
LHTAVWTGDIRDTRPISDIAEPNSDEENFDRMKHAIAALAVARPCGKS